MVVDGSRTIAVTGSTGRLGGRVARRLAESGVAQRLIVRDVGRAPELPAAEARQATYDDTDAVAAALRGADVVLMVSAAENPDRVGQHRAFIDGAVRAGVGHLVYTSFVGADAGAVFTLGRDHFRTEEYIRESGVAFTFLRDNLYADFFPMMVGQDDVIRGPAGNGPRGGGGAGRHRRRGGRRAHESGCARRVGLQPVRAGGTHPDPGRRDDHRGQRSAGVVPRGDVAGGVRIAGLLRRARLAGRGVGLDVHRHRRRGIRRGHRRRRIGQRSPRHPTGRSRPPPSKFCSSCLPIQKRAGTSNSSSCGDAGSRGVGSSGEERFRPRQGFRWCRRR